MKKSLPLILLALVIILGVAGYFVWKHLEKKGGAPTPPKKQSNTTSPAGFESSPGLESAPEIFIRKPLWIEPLPVAERFRQPAITTAPPLTAGHVSVDVLKTRKVGSEVAVNVMNEAYAQVLLQERFDRQHEERMNNRTHNSF